MIPMPVIWLIAIVVFAVAEAATLGLTSIWFACGSLLAMLVALVGGNIWWQLIIFIVGSGVLLAVTRQWVGKLKLGRVKTNADSIVGKHGLVVEPIDNSAARGQIRIGGQIWTARSQGETPIAKGIEVEIMEISGVKAIVRPLENQ